MTIIIYLTADKKSFHVIKPTAAFDRNVQKLVEHLTHSDRKEGIRNFYSYEIL
jgi:hypothetical protein